METFDAAILGLGAVGSAAVFQLAKQGVRAVGIDRLAPPHTFGSSHGGSRITRLAIGEGAHLTPIARRSHALWREIERETGSNLLSETGALIISSAAKTSFTHVADFFVNTVSAARKHHIAHEILDAAAIRDRFPQFRIGDDESAYFEPGGGYLRPEACVRAQLDLARRHGADMRLNECVTGLVPRATDVLITTDKTCYTAQTLVIAAGAWLPDLLDHRFSRIFRVFRQTQYWFAPRDDSFAPDRFPVFIWELSGRAQAIYGFPDFDGTGVKVATEQFAATTDSFCAERDIAPGEAADMYETYVAPFLPGVTAHCKHASACLYTVTPDFGFVLDRHPDSDRVIIASCCSGHGFKHSAAIGEAVAELIVDGRSRLDLSPFALARLSVC